MPLTAGERSERNRIGGRARFAHMTAEQRSDLGRQAALASAVNQIIRRVSELKPDQLNRIRVMALVDHQCPACGHREQETELTDDQKARLRALAAELAQPTEAPDGP